MSPYGSLVRYAIEHMTPEAHVVLLLVLHNIHPRLHRSLAPIDVAFLVHSTLEGTQVNVVCIIMNELKMVIEETYLMLLGKSTYSFGFSYFDYNYLRS